MAPTAAPNSNPEFLSPASGMFSHSQQFTVMGKTFTNITKNYVAAPGLPSDFRMIPMGDIDLRREIRVDECTGVVNSQPRERACVRRIHSAKAIIAGRKSRVTVAIYQGNGAEKEWRQDIAKYMSLRQVPCAETVTTFIDSLTLEQYHRICAWHLGQLMIMDVSAFTTVNLGAVFLCSGDRLEDSNEIVFLPNAEALSLGDWRIVGGGTAHVMLNGWTRFQAGDVLNRTLSICLTLFPDRNVWLAQANHIFRRLHVMPNFQNYVVVDDFCFYLEFLQITRELSPEGFLFLCPQEDFQTGPSSFRCPACAGYWSLDPTGTNRLSLEEAARLGFPSFVLTSKANGWYWNSSVYDGVRQVHQSKGFDPYSQDVARHLGYSLYHLSSQAEGPLAYVDPNGEDFDADIDPDGNSAHADDYESEYPPTLASDNPDLAVGTESVYYEGDVHDLAGENCGSEYMSNCEDHDVSELTVEGGMIAEEMPVPPPIFRIVLYMEFVAILFLALSWIYDDI
ncbi:hypothetical protein MSAN_00129500 [Mycena sanguinolenta]|uniref:Uncharacterized protein n=1 Tax=Mycena sanguinolenta TaxID=230812 RepID=A0A8H6ZKE3_9AGAR|nr:hypothetical protein MSAN_00129500 [Mycena sanguinolenta]